MRSVTVALVSDDPSVRLAAAEAFDKAPTEWTLTLHTEPPSNADVVVFGPDARGPDGAPRFDPHRPGSLLTAISSASPRSGGGPIVVGSASGGTGVTSVALHLAAALSARASVCLVDLDPARGTALRLGIDALPPYPERPQDDLALAAVPVAGGFRVLAAPSADIRGAVERAAAAFGRVIVDAGCTGPTDVVPVAGVLVMVVPPSVPAALRAKEVLTRLSPARVAVVTNRVGPGGETTRAAVERMLGRRVGLELPCSPALRDAEDDRRLLTATFSPWRIAIARLARALEDA